MFDNQADIGAVKHPGAARYSDADDQAYVLSGSGQNMWFGQDEFHLVYKKLSGDFVLTAEVAFLGEGVDPHRKAGLIVRPDLEGDSPYVDVALHGDGLTSMQFRKTRGSETEEVPSGVTGPDVLRLERSDDRFIMSVAKRGDEFTTRELDKLILPDSIYLGLFVCSHNPEVIEEARFHNVRVTRPAPPGFRPYQDYIGSRLETLEVDTGVRRVLRTDRGSLQAPNWTRDGAALIYNQDGRLHRFDLATEQTTEIDTGFAVHNNNDHAISFDGAHLAISHHSEEHGGDSIIYTLPLEGGTPRLVTPTGPSYLHGWSPDGEWLTFTGGRDDVYDIYRIPADGSGLEERLTHQATLDDGSEYSPDGEWIYFNSARTGKMQIWRMKPDGSNHQQVTDDALNNWFPHVSPDGERLVMLSYGAEVAAEDHPWYRRVTLRMMPTDGGTPRVIGYVYGGQGTMNVASWSPDGKRIAFVSNTR